MFMPFMVHAPHAKGLSGAVSLPPKTSFAKTLSYSAMERPIERDLLPTADGWPMPAPLRAPLGDNQIDGDQRNEKHHGVE
jgi:hypothetical protein